MCEQPINVHALKQIQSDIIRYSPYPKLVNIIAVTKNFNITAIQSAVENNIYQIGENRVQEYSKKITDSNYEKQIESHLIGKLQTNKVNKAVGLFDTIQTVDSLRLAEKINNRAQTINMCQCIFVQINIGSDPNKGGFFLNGVYKEIEKIQKLEHIHLLGIMTILPLGLTPKKTQTLFKATKDIQLKVQKTISPTCKFVSMGMSGDYIAALKEGSTHIRIGTKLYGQRK